MKEKDNPGEKVFIDKEELDGIEIDNILNSENFMDGGELTRKLLTKRSQKFYKPINVHPVTYAIRESVSSTSM